MLKHCFARSCAVILPALLCSSTTVHASDVLAPGVKPKLVLERGAGEGPAWHPERGLFFSGGNRITRLAKDGTTHVVLDPSGSNGLLFDRQRRLIVCQPGRRRVVRIDVDGKVTVLTEMYRGKRYNTPNDVTIDSRGRIYFSDPRYGRRDGMEVLDEEGKTVEGVYRIDTTGSVARIITHEVDRPNGVLVSRDDRFLFVADNNNNLVGGARKLWRFELRKNGTVDAGSRRLLFDWKTGRGPDGMVQDTAGRLYVAGGLNKPHPPAETADEYKGGVYVLTPEGRLLEFIAIPRDEVTNCTFGDADLRTLYITAGGTLWSIRTKTPGWLPWPRAR